MFSNVLEMSNMSGKEAKINLLESLYETNSHLYQQKNFNSQGIFSLFLPSTALIRDTSFLEKLPIVPY